jgi:hypothetical protein
VIRRWGGLIAVLLLAGCTLVEPQTTPEITRADLAQRLDETRRDQAAALDLWDRIIFGELVSCQEVIPVPESFSVTAQDGDLRAIQGQLNAAIQAVRNSSDLWNIECNADRDYVPLNMAQEGRTTALAAGPPLEAAAAMLATYGG